jgi:hypothetical protein
MLTPHSGVTNAKIDRLKKGMTLGEVEALLGERGKDDGGHHGVNSFYWLSEDGLVAINFDRSDHVLYIFRYTRDDMFQRIRRWMNPRKDVGAKGLASPPMPSEAF